MVQVTVTIPYYRSPSTIVRAVEAVLNQTHNDLICVVVNDGDTESPPWPHLQHITDPRLIRYDLPANRGRYFADAVTLAACDTEWITVHDADDAARPTWLQSQLQAARTHQASAVFCGHLLHGITNRTPRPERPQRYTGTFRHHAHMAGLWRTTFLRDLGGPRPDFRVGYDTMITGAAMATGKCYLHHEVLYERYLQKTSLTKSADTRIGSSTRKKARDWMARVWPSVTAAARISPRRVGEVLERGVPDDLRQEIKNHAAYLRQKMTDTPQPEEAHLWATCLNNSSLWGDWALNEETGRSLARELEKRKPSVIIEAGSGTSTLLFSQWADTHGAKVLALESSAAFQKKTRQLLELHGTGKNTEVRYAPLHTTPDGPWYTYDTLPKDIDFALVDGPRERDGGRRAAMAALLPHLMPGALVILDDTNRTKEQSDLAEWKRRYGLPYTAANNSAAYVDIPKPDASSTGGAKVAVTLLTGRRPVLLENTLHRMQTCAPGLLRRAHLTVLHNGGDEATAAVLTKYANLIDVTFTTSTVLSIGEATSLLAQQVTRSGRKYWLHLEDDWAALPITADWLARAQTILHTRRNIYQVRLRHHTESTLRKHMVTGRTISWSTLPGFRMALDGHYTNNPSLVRIEDARKIWPAGGEREAQRNAWKAGLRGVAQLTPGAFVHTGEENSLRQETKCAV